LTDSEAQLLAVSPGTGQNVVFTTQQFQLASLVKL